MNIEEFLKSHAISYERFEHPAVFTCEESAKIDIDIPGVGTKNLFLRDKNATRYFLVTVGHETSVDLKALRDMLGVSKLSFGAEDKLKELLGVTPGSVTLMGLIHDTNHIVEVIIDAPLWGSMLQCHPLVNTATLALPHSSIEKFFAATGHIPRVLAVPARTL